MAPTLSGPQITGAFAPYSVGPCPPAQATGGHPYMNYENPSALSEQLEVARQCHVGKDGGQLAWPVFATDLLAWNPTRGSENSGGLRQFLHGAATGEGPGAHWQWRLVLDPSIDPQWLVEHPQANAALQEIAGQAWALQVPFWPQISHCENWYAALSQASAGRLILSVDNASEPGCTQAETTAETLEKANQIPDVFALNVPLSLLAQTAFSPRADNILVRCVPANSLMRLDLQQTYRELVQAQARWRLQKNLVVTSDDLRSLPLRSHSQEQIEFPALTWVSFAQEKIRETQVLAAALHQGQTGTIAAFAAATIARTSWQTAGVSTQQLAQICRIDKDFSYPDFFAALRELNAPHIASEQGIT